MTGQQRKQAARRKRNARRQRELREERDKAKKCRACGRPVAISKKTGLPARQCRRHLGRDSKRKDRERAAVPLRWIGRSTRAKRVARPLWVRKSDDGNVTALLDGQWRAVLPWL